MNLLCEVLYKGHYNLLIYSIFIMEVKLVLFTPQLDNLFYLSTQVGHVGNHLLKYIAFDIEFNMGHIWDCLFNIPFAELKYLSISAGYFNVSDRERFK